MTGPRSKASKTLSFLKVTLYCPVTIDNPCRTRRLLIGHIALKDNARTHILDRHRLRPESTAPKTSVTVPRMSPKIGVLSQRRLRAEQDCHCNTCNTDLKRVPHTYLLKVELQRLHSI